MANCLPRKEVRRHKKPEAIRKFAADAITEAQKQLASATPTPPIENYPIAIAHCTLRRRDCKLLSVFARTF
jgi:hypothetical protein